MDRANDVSLLQLEMAKHPIRRVSCSPYCIPLGRTRSFNESSNTTVIPLIEKRLAGYACEFCQISRGRDRDLVGRGNPLSVEGAKRNQAILCKAAVTGNSGCIQLQIRGLWFYFLEHQHSCGIDLGGSELGPLLGMGSDRNVVSCHVAHVRCIRTSASFLEMERQKICLFLGWMFCNVNLHDLYYSFRRAITSFAIFCQIGAHLKRLRTILLATPPYHAGVVESAGIWPPLGLVYIAGELRRYGYNVEIYDSMSRQDSLEDVRAYLRSKDYDVLGVSSITASIVTALEMMKISKEENPKAYTVLGNVHGTFLYDELLEKHADIIDFIVRGEGEATMSLLMNAIFDQQDAGKVAGLAFRRNGHTLVTPGRRFIQDLNSLEPAWDLLDWSLYKFFVIPNSRLGILNSSRGCPHACSFCSQQKFWERGYRELKPERFVEQLRVLRNGFGVNVVMLSDEYPTKNQERWEAILDSLIVEDIDVCLLLETRVEDIVRDADILWKYRAAKVLHIYVGVEATNQMSLDIFRKDVKCEQSQEALRLIAANGMVSECSFVLGMPEETFETIATTLALAKHYNPDFAHFLAIAPWPYSDLYSDVKDYIEVRDYSKYNLVTPIVKPKAMTLDEVNQAIIQCYKEFYMWKVPRFSQEPDEFRREYLLRSTRVMMNNSFLTKHMRGGEMPVEVREYLDKKASCPFAQMKQADVAETRF